MIALGRNAEAVGEEGDHCRGLERRPVDRFRTAVVGTIGHGHRGRSGGVLGPHVVQPPAEHDQPSERERRRRRAVEEADDTGCGRAEHVGHLGMSVAQGGGIRHGWAAGQ